MCCCAFARPRHVVRKNRSPRPVFLLDGKRIALPVLIPDGQLPLMVRGRVALGAVRGESRGDGTARSSYRRPATSKARNLAPHRPQLSDKLQAAVALNGLHGLPYLLLCLLYRGRLVNLLRLLINRRWGVDRRRVAVRVKRHLNLYRCDYRRNYRRNSDFLLNDHGLVADDLAAAARVSVLRNQ